MRFGMCNRVSLPRHSGIVALALIWMAVSCMSAASAPQGRTERIVIDGKEVQHGSDLATQTAPRAGRDTDVKWSDDRGSGSIKAKNAELTSDLDDIKYIAEGGYFSIDETRGRVTRRFRAEPGRDGKIKRAYMVNGEAHEFDVDAKKWLAGLLHEYFEDSSQRKP
ncbi:MAG: hypothetical protein QOE33_3308 [Acidobacteriota bacterium]|nr:hypothetical protein [Acidobacteriota bacterium]